MRHDFFMLKVLVNMACRRRVFVVFTSRFTRGKQAHKIENRFDDVNSGFMLFQIVQYNLYALGSFQRLNV